MLGSLSGEALSVKPEESPVHIGLLCIVKSALVILR